MKDFLQGDADRRIVGIGVHDVRHARPPFFDDFRLRLHGERISQHGFSPFARRRQGQRGALLLRGYGMTRNIIFLIADYHVNVNVIESFLPVKKNM